ncbi:hypothetical protein TWF696_007479 [Orbilia brochopaga]
MQVAARAVATENQRLRMLLSSVGVSEEKVAEYLRTSHDRPAPTDVRMDVDQTKKSSTQCHETIGKEDVASGKDDALPLDSENNTIPEAPDHSSLDRTDIESSDQTQTEPKPTKSSHTRSRLCSSSSTSSPTLETPCETAASIILRMRGQDDESAVYSRFGCEDGFPKSCRIKNTILFQLMDEM